MAVSYRAVARIEKAHGNKGKVVAVSCCGLARVLSTGMEVAIVPPELKLPRHTRVIEVDASRAPAAVLSQGEVWPEPVKEPEGAPRTFSGDFSQLIALEGINDRNDAEQIVGKTLLVRVEDLPPEFFLVDTDMLVGRVVLDSELNVSGTITDVRLGVAQNLWVLDIDGAEVLLPVVDDFIDSISEEGPIHVHIPPGLLDL